MSGSKEIKLFLCGDVMLGRGVDQILKHHVDPRIFEGYMKDARGYVQIAEDLNGPFPQERGVDYVWGDLIGECSVQLPHFRLINLETSITDRGTPWPDKGIQYRVHPKNVDVLKAAKIDFCALGNNHILDWGYEGLKDTVATLHENQIRFAGAGETEQEAFAPAIFPLSVGHRLVVASFGDQSSGVFESWAAKGDRGGVNYIQLDGQQSVLRVKAQLDRVRQPGDIVVASIHQGSNWGYAIDREFIPFAKSLIDIAKVDVLHCHSSHHFKGISVYKSKLIIWGCGDFLTDYEGIRNQSHSSYHGELSFMYFPTIDLVSGNLTALTLTPTKLRHFAVHYADVDEDERKWMFETMQRECSRLGTDIEEVKEGPRVRFKLRWDNQVTI